MVSLAKALKGMGFPVTFVTWDHGQRDGEILDGLKVYKCFAPNDGLPLLRFLHPRWTMLNSALQRADADVYFQSCADSLTGQVALWARRHRRRFVFFVMHDWHCIPELPGLRTRREQLLYRYGLRAADCIVAQSIRQKAQLALWPGMNSTVIYPTGGRQSDQLPLASFSDHRRPRVLWVGRLAKVKRLDWLLEIARALPECDFDVVGGANSTDVDAERFLCRAREFPNITLHGAVPHTSMDPFYQSALALLSTSSAEGFPSVFIEAWSWGLPVVAALDIDDLISHNNLGIVGHSVPALVEALRSVFKSRERWTYLSRQALGHYVRSHSPAIAARTMSRILMAGSKWSSDA